MSELLWTCDGREGGGSSPGDERGSASEIGDLAQLVAVVLRHGLVHGGGDNSLDNLVHDERSSVVE